MNFEIKDLILTEGRMNLQKHTKKYFRSKAMMALKREINLQERSMPSRYYSSEPIISNLKKTVVVSEKDISTSSKTVFAGNGVATNTSTCTGTAVNITREHSSKRRALNMREAFTFRKLDKRNLKIAKEQAKENLLNIRLKRERLEPFYCIPDEDRAIINEAIRAKLNLEYIQVLLHDYPKACEVGGCVDHVHHPIHIACQEYRQAVPTLLRHNPECASQCNEKGESPIELFLRNNDPIDITSEELASTTNLLIRLDPTNVGGENCVFARRDSLKQRVLLNGLIPEHLKYSMQFYGNGASALNSGVTEQVREEIMAVSRRLSMEL